MKKIYITTFDGYPEKAFWIKSNAEDYLKKLKEEKRFTDFLFDQLYDIMEMELE